MGVGDRPLDRFLFLLALAGPSPVRLDDDPHGLVRVVGDVDEIQVLRGDLLGGREEDLIQSIIPPQNSVPIRTTGKEVTFRVWTSVSASNSSSSVPKPPGNVTNPQEYFTNMVLRTKK
nr:hypothetical protein GCM10020093_060260 [Planobispora longispora]